jgi:hypothetical protein
MEVVGDSLQEYVTFHLRVGSMWWSPNVGRFEVDVAHTLRLL